MKPRDHYVDNRGLRLHVVEWEPFAAVSRETIILHHGFLEHARAWDGVARRLAERFHVLALDARGFGDSDWVSHGGYYYFTDYLWDLDTIRRALARDSFVLVGHSMGGMVVAMYAGAFPDRPRGLVSLEGFGAPEVPVEDTPSRVAEWVDSLQREKTYARSALPDVDAAAARLSRHNPGLSPAVAQHLAEHGTRPTEGGGLCWKWDPVHLTRSPMTFQVERAQAYWGRVTCPTLLMSGSESLFTRGDERETIPHARRVVIRGATHAMHTEKPEAVAREILDFVDGLSSP